MCSQPCLDVIEFETRCRNKLRQVGRRHYGASRPIVAVYQVEQEWEASLQEHVKYSRQAQVLKTVPSTHDLHPSIAAGSGAARSAGNKGRRIRTHRLCGK